MTFGIDSPDWNTPVGISNGNYVYRVMTENRKRPREEESCEFMPLSKRINNLHINNNLGSSAATSIPESSHHNGMSAESQPSSDIRQPNYDPGVNSSQSPYFFDNKLLFELHLERIQRSGQQFPF